MTGCFFVIILIALLFVVVLWNSKFDGFRFIPTNRDYQYSNPALNRENWYYQCVRDECNNSTNDYNCLQKCHLKTFRKGFGFGDSQGPAGWRVFDHADYVCLPYKNNQEEYYKCLNAVYTNYHYP